MLQTIKVVTPKWQDTVFYTTGQGNIEMKNGSVWKIPDTMNSIYFMPTTEAPQYIINCKDCDPMSVIVVKDTQEKQDNNDETEEMTAKEITEKILEIDPDTVVKWLKKSELLELYKSLK